VRSSKLRYKQKYVPLRRQKFSMPVHEDGIPLVRTEIGKWSKKAWKFSGGSCSLGFISTASPGSDSGGGSWHALLWYSRLMALCAA